MALSEILLVVAALAYLVCGVGIVKVLNAPEAVAPAWLRTVGFVGFAAHAVGVLMNMFAPGAIRFGFGMAVSALLCISVAIVLVESLVHRINGLMGIVIVVSAFGTALPVVFQGELFPAQEWSILFRVHLLMALAAYSFMTIAVVQAILLTRKEREVANPATLNKGGLLSSMPSLLAMERILFRIVACGFACLTCVLILGAMATYELHQTYFIFEHKTILTWLSWIVFAVLLAGRYFLGWRKKKALSWFWAGIVFLAVAYLVYRFILDAMIHSRVNHGTNSLLGHSDRCHLRCLCVCAQSPQQGRGT